MKTQLMLRGISEDDGMPFIKEIHSLDEVRKTGNYLVIGRDVSVANGLPVIKGKTGKCFCCEALLSVTCCYSEDEAQSKSAYGQKLTICDYETGNTNVYTRTFRPQKNSGEWSLWQMSAIGSIELVTNNNEINDTIENLSEKITIEANRAKEIEEQIERRLGQNFLEINDVASRNSEIIQKGVTMKFDRIVNSEETIETSTLEDVCEVVYYKRGNIFVGVDNAGHFYIDWNGCDMYMNNGEIRKDKVYICDGELYVWNGIELDSATPSIVKSWILTEAYTVTGVERDADDYVLSASITYPNGVLGRLSIVYNDGLAQSVLCTYNSFNYTITISRDNNGNVITTNIQ